VVSLTFEAQKSWVQKLYFSCQTNYDFSFCDLASKLHEP